MQCIRVDLPDPDGPMTAVNSAATKSMETPSSAATCGIPLAIDLAQVDGAGGDPVPCGVGVVLWSTAESSR